MKMISTRIHIGKIDIHISNMNGNEITINKIRHGRCRRNLTRKFIKFSSINELLALRIVIDEFIKQYYAEKEVEKLNG